MQKFFFYKLPSDIPLSAKNVVNWDTIDRNCIKLLKMWYSDTNSIYDFRHVPQIFRLHGMLNAWQTAVHFHSLFAFWHTATATLYYHYRISQPPKKTLLRLPTSDVVMSFKSLPCSWGQKGWASKYFRFLGRCLKFTNSCWNCVCSLAYRIDTRTYIHTHTRTPLLKLTYANLYNTRQNMGWMGFL